MVRCLDRRRSTAGDCTGKAVLSRRLTYPKQLGVHAGADKRRWLCVRESDVGLVREPRPDESGLRGFGTMAGTQFFLKPCVFHRTLHFRCNSQLLGMLLIFLQHYHVRYRVRPKSYDRKEAESAAVAPTHYQRDPGPGPVARAQPSSKESGTAAERGGKS